MISAFVIAKNEASRIAECLDSLAWCDEVVVVDSESTDETADIARQKGARVFVHPFSGYSEQRNFAIDHCRGDWIVYLDADERPGPGFSAEARSIEQDPDACEGYWVHSLEYFMGDFLRHGGFGLHQYNRKVRLWRNRDAHRFTGSVHERVTVHGRIGTMNAYVEHRSSAATVSGLVEKLNRYSDLEKRPGTVRSRDLVLAPLREFVSRYVKHQGFRDGARGFIVAQAYAFYELATVAKALERQRAGARRSDADPALSVERQDGAHDDAE